MRKKFNLYHHKRTMSVSLPLDQFRFNLTLRVLITAYGASGVWNFMAFVPWCNRDDAKILWYKQRSNYAFRLISSLIFLYIWISQFQYTSLVYLSIGEIYIIVIMYLYITIRNWSFSRKNKNNSKNINKFKKSKRK